MFSIADFSIVSLRNIKLFEGARPSKIFPALSSGTPVLYCGAGESADILNEYHCGKIAPPENPEGIAEAVKELCTLPEEEFAAMCKNGRELAISQYSWKSIVDDLLNNMSELEKSRGH
jgi:glycosyltransferase involved in cell wall biosynthesis